LKQLHYIQRHLSGYSIIASDRVIDEISQYPTLFYCEKAFSVNEKGEFWLSRTPDVHRSKDWDSAYPRMMSYALLEDKETKRELWVIVTHLDNRGSEARKEQAKIICEWISRRSGPIILMGDFNDHPGSTVHQILTSPETGLKDTWQVLGRDEDKDSMTYHGFQGIPKKARIDWILLTSHFQVLDAHIIRDHYNGYFPSDHFPYMVEIEWV